MQEMFFYIYKYLLSIAFAFKYFKIMLKLMTGDFFFKIYLFERN